MDNIFLMVGLLHHICIMDWGGGGGGGGGEGGVFLNSY